jgi:hypothetical protein
MLSKSKSIVLASLAVVLMGCGGGGGGGGDASPDIWAVNSVGQLMKFDLDATNDIDSTIAITGLQPGEVIEAIDFRPATDELYGLGSTSRLYKLNLTTGVATLVGGGQLAVLLSGGFFGFDFNPVVDLIRIVSDADLSMRVNPDTGVVVDGDAVAPGTQPDTSLNPSGDVAAAAYTNSSAGATLTTLFGIDATSDQLVRIGGVDGTPSPNGGALTNIGPLGVNVNGAIGFDIKSDGTAVMIRSLGGNVNEIYTINLATGAATLVGQVLNGGNVRAISIRD